MNINELLFPARMYDRWLHVAGFVLGAVTGVMHSFGEKLSVASHTDTRFLGFDD